MRNTTPTNLIEVINATEPNSSTKPVDHVIAELFQMSSALNDEKGKFIAKGLTDDFISVSAHLGKELQNRQANWVAGRFISSEQKLLWDELSPKGYDIRDMLVDDLEIAFYGNDELMRSLNVIKKGDGPEDMLQDLPQLTTVAESNMELASVVGITEESLLEVKQFSDSCAEAFASITVTPEQSAALKNSRDKAKAFATEYLSLIRFYADRIYRTDPETRQRFTSAYYRENRKTTNDN